MSAIESPRACAARARKRLKRSWSAARSGKPLRWRSRRRCRPRRRRSPCARTGRAGARGSGRARRARRTSSQRSSGQPSSGLPSHGSGSAGVRAAALERAGAEVADHARAPGVQRGDGARGRLEQVDVVELRRRPSRSSGPLSCHCQVVVGAGPRWVDVDAVDAQRAPAAPLAMRVGQANRERPRPGGAGRDLGPAAAGQRLRDGAAGADDEARRTVAALPANRGRRSASGRPP